MRNLKASIERVALFDPSVASPRGRALWLVCGWAFSLALGLALFALQDSNGWLSGSAVFLALLIAASAAAVGAVLVRTVDATRRRVTPAIVLYLLGATLLLVFAVFVWPTRYRNDTVHMSGRSYTARIDRFTGDTYVISPNGWRRVTWTESQPR